MKLTTIYKIIFIIVITIYFTSCKSFAGGIPEDKFLHFSISAFISHQTYAISRENHISKPKSYAIAVCTTLALGMAKELTDDHIDNKDLLADALGAFIAPILIYDF